MHKVSVGLALVSLLASPALHAEELPTLDQNELRLPIAESQWTGTRGSLRHEGFLTTARLSFLDRPLAVSVPTASAEGTESDLVRGSIVFEIAANMAWNNGVDFGLATGGNFYQWGSGYDPITGAQSGLASVGAHDTRLELGWSTPVDTWSTRPFASLYLPWGSARAFTAERKVRFELGTAFSFTKNRWLWNSELSLLFRPVQTISSTTLSSQAHLSSGLSYLISPHFRSGLELVLLPFLAPQVSPSGEKLPQLLPAEALWNFSYHHDKWEVMASAGTGLPFTKSEDALGNSSFVRAPGAPVLRGLLQVKLHFDSSN